MSAYARVELVGATKHIAMGRPDFKKGQVRYLSNAADIAYFKLQPAFKVQDLDPHAPQPDRPRRRGGLPVKPGPQKPGAIVKKMERVKMEPPPPPPAPPASEPEPAADLPEWKPSMSKQELIEAAAARNIPVTPEDKKADLIELLRMHDEDADGEGDEGEDDEDADDEDADADDEDEG